MLGGEKHSPGERQPCVPGLWAGPWGDLRGAGGLGACRTSGPEYSLLAKFLRGFSIHGHLQASRHRHTPRSSQAEVPGLDKVNRTLSSCLSRAVRPRFASLTRASPSKSALLP